MPLVRKLTTVGHSRGITLPKSWIDYYEKENSCRITEIALIVEDSRIILTPILPKERS